jgi:hypothetical protein
MRKAILMGIDAVGTNWSATPQRIVYNMGRNMSFSIDNSLVEYTPSVEAWNAKSDNVAINGDEVPSDCISGASMVMFAALMCGLPGSISAVPLTYESETETTTAVTYTWESHYDAVNGFEFIMVDGGNNPNAFEGTVVYAVSGKSFYFPIGTATGWSLDGADKVLRVMKQPAKYYDNGDVVLFGALYAALDANDFYSID